MKKYVTMSARLIKNVTSSPAVADYVTMSAAVAKRM